MGIFEIIGPSMIGPSSSHTAGACRIGWLAYHLLGEKPRRVRIQLHGSFLATGDGHGTKEALVAGILGMAPDDEELINAREKAALEQIEITFDPIDLGSHVHSNSAKINLEGKTHQLTLVASSVGGGSISLMEIDGLPVSISGTLETLVLWHHDTPGFLACITAILACVQVNVATIRTSRLHRGEHAITIVEIDGVLPEEVPNLFKKIPAIHRLAVLPPVPGI